MHNDESTPQKLIKNFSQGFTLIEIMIVFALSAVMAGGGFFAFTNYARAQALSQAVEEMRLTYEEAHNNAISNVKPSSCDSASVLRGYRVDLANNKYTVVLDCSSGEIAVEHPLPGSIRLRNVGGGNPTNCTGLYFKVITGNVSGPLPCNIEIFHVDEPANPKTMQIQSDGRVMFN